MLLTALAGAIPAAASPQPAVASASPPPTVAEHVTDLSQQPSPLAVVRQVETGIPTELVAFQWDGTAPAEIDIRSRSGSGWSDWTTVAGELTEGPDANSKEFRADTSAGPVWVGHGVRQIQYRIISGQPTHLRMHAIRFEDTAASSGPSTTAGVGQPRIISRAQWGADESWRTFAPGCDGSVSLADNVHYLIVHHTVTSNNYGPGDSASIVRGIYYYHTHSNLWCDIGYNFFVDQYGQIFEGRYGGIDQPVIGAHAGGFNTGSAGIALLGTFNSVYPSAAMYSALRSLAGWKAWIHDINPGGTVTVVAGDFPEAHWPPGTTVTLPTIIGHRDVDSTDCPGGLAYSVLARLRQDVAADVGPRWYPTAGGLYQRHADGSIWAYTGTPMSGWLLLDNNPATVNVVTDGTDIYQLHSNGTIWRFTGTPLTGWVLLDNNPAASQLAASGGHLYQLHHDGSIWQYLGTPLTGWLLLDYNPAAVGIYADGYNLYQFHRGGTIWQYAGTPLTGWLLLDNNPAAVQLAASGGHLYQLHHDGTFFQYTGVPLTGWLELDHNPATMAITAEGNNLYQLHHDGTIFQYTGVPLTGWLEMDNNPATVATAAGGGHLYQLHQGGTIWQYLGPPLTGWVELDNNPATVALSSS